MMMRRAALAAGLVFGVLAAPLAGEAQRPAMPVIGLLGSRSATDSAPHVAAFLAALGEAGHVEQQNVTIERRYADGKYDRLPALAAELVRRQVAVIFSTGPPAALAAKAATTSTPVIFVSGSGPLKSGLVTSLNRPGANVTGISLFTGQLGAKQLGLLRSLCPALPWSLCWSTRAIR